MSHHATFSATLIIIFCNNKVHCRANKLIVYLENATTAELLSYFDYAVYVLCNQELIMQTLHIKTTADMIRHIKQLQGLCNDDGCVC